MATRALRSIIFSSAFLLTCIVASPAPTSQSNSHRTVPHNPVITPATTYHAALHRRDILSSLENGIDSVLSDLGNVPSYVASGLDPFFLNYPTSDAVVSSLGLNSAQVSALPTQVLNIDPYANYTDQGWNVRFHGNVYKQPNTSIEDLNKLADVFIPKVDITSLPESEQDQARNLTAEIFVLQQGNVAVSSIQVEPVNGTTGGEQQVVLPYNTTAEGDFDVFVPIASDGLTPGNTTSAIQKLSTNVGGATLGNATAYLVPDEGLTIVSDIDDILRVTQIYEPELGLNNTFVKPFVPWQSMPEIYANWSSSLPDMHFHYLTTTPEQITRNYMQFIYANYPLGSFDTRPLNFSNVAETLSVRKYLLVKIFQTFPHRKFILIADTSNSDVMRDYPAMAHDYPDQVQCIFLRNTTATDPGDRFPYDTSGFQGLNQSMYMFFVNSVDLYGLDLAAGHCYNSSIAQNLTFGYQGLPLGAGSTTSVNGSANSTKSSAAVESVRGNLPWMFMAVLGSVVFAFL